MQLYNQSNVVETVSNDPENNSADLSETGGELTSSTPQTSRRREISVTSNDTEVAELDDDIATTPPLPEPTNVNFTTNITGSNSLTADYDTPPMCLDAEEFLHPPIQADCLQAARAFKASPLYKLPITYTKGDPPLPGMKALPLIYFHKTCVLWVDAADDSPDQDVIMEKYWSRFSALYQQCILFKKPGHQWGGKVWIGEEGKGMFFWLGGESTPFASSSSSLPLSEKSDVVAAAALRNETGVETS